MKIVFFGTPEFAVASLDAIVKAGHEVAAVVTMPDKPAGRGHHLYQSPVKEYAVAHSIPVLQPEKLKSEDFLETLRKIDAPLFVVIAFRMLPEIVWNMPALGTFNLHASLLPKYRGAAPINHAVMNGETQTGVTTFFLKHEIDTGDIIDRATIEIGPEENVGSVHDRLMELGAHLTVKTINAIEAGNLCTTPQDELLAGIEACPAPKIFKETCEIHWNQSSKKIHDHIRGLSPYPAAWTTLEGKMLKVLAARINTCDSTSAQTSANSCPGRFIVAQNRMIVKCGEGEIELLEVQPQGKRRMPVADWLRGARLQNDGIFEECKINE